MTEAKMTIRTRRAILTGGTAIAGLAILPKRVRAAGDDTATLQAALNAIPDGGTLTLQAREYKYSAQLTTVGKSNITIEGQPGTVLRSTNKNASAFVLQNINGLTLRGIRFEGCATARSQASAAGGVDLWDVDNAVVENVHIRNIACFGLRVSWNTGTEVSDGVVVRFCHIDRSWSDGFRVEGASNVEFVGCLATNTGDDSFSAIGYGGANNVRNTNVTIRQCASLGSGASGIAIEGTDGALVEYNVVSRSRVAGIRIASSPGYNTVGVSGCVVRENRLIDVRTDASVGHGAIERAAGNGDVECDVLDNIVFNPPPLGIVHDNAQGSYTVTGTVSGNVSE